ncbi:hypothetical protein P6144_06110 [Sphingomonas sp. HITSZ_GF]|uniref:hypothetical protein n=1 Tax=Sphingomonas sp. HITSZ_GF TaxID=3037247 RepID=UPI00240CF7F8|nr:hypothetical protein [Sphingomonas sp. HITSZ_GF]MDG2533212.1 hypothetical protein [Sphingomonas sp. HITSZ_GF]
MRHLLLPLAVIACTPLAATAKAPVETTYRGHIIDWQGALPSADIVKSIEQQIDLVEDVQVSPEVMAFFRAQPILINEDPEEISRAGRRTFLARRVHPADNPVLLHELIHRWMYDRIAGGARNPELVRLYDAAKASGDFPANAYMLKNPTEFLAMTASVVIHGRAARPPFTRDNVRRKLPDVYAYVVREFGFHE